MPSTFRTFALISLAFTMLGVAKPEYEIHTIKTAAANVFVVAFQDKTLMIDCGNVGDSLKIERKLKNKGIPPESIDYLLLTHGHLDHAGNAAYFQRKYGIKIIGSRHDIPLFSSGKNDELCPTNGMAKAIAKAFGGLTYEPFDIDMAVDSVLHLSSLGMAGEVLALPGHTPGSLIFMLNDKAFVGDLIRGQPLRKHHPVRHYYMCDEHDNDTDIQWLLEKESVITWYPGHFGTLKSKNIAKRFVQDEP